MFKYLITAITMLLLGISTPAASQGNFVSIRVSIPGSLADELASRGANDVDQLTLRGMIDDRDVMTIRRMLFVKYLDISQTDLRTIPANAFASMRNLTTILLPSAIKRIGRSAFESCLALVDFRLPERVTEIGASAFYNCKSLSRMELPASVEKLGDEAFMSCTSLGEVIIEGSCAIGARAFAGCSALRVVVCLSPTPPPLELSAFEGTPPQKQLAVPPTALQAYAGHEVWGQLFTDIVPID